MTSLPPTPGDAAALGADPAERLRAVLFETGVAAAFEWYLPETRIIGDAGFAAIYGLTPAEALAGVPGATFFAAIHPKDRSRIRLAMGGVARGAELLSKEFRIVPPAKGAVRWVHLRGRTYFSPEGSPERFCGTVVDITEQKRLEEQLRVAQSAGGVGAFEHVLGFGTVSVSTKFCSLLGLYPATHLPLQTVNAVVFPGDPPIIGPVGTERSGTTIEDEIRIVFPGDRDPRWLMRRGEYLGDEAHGVRFSGVIYDITAAKQTEAQLRTLNETLEERVALRTRERDRIWRVSEDLLGVADDQGVWLSVNPAWERLLGWTEAEIVGRTADWLECPASPSVRAATLQLAQGARMSGFESRMRTRDGAERSLSWAAVRDGEHIYCVARDVTAAQQSALALADAEEQLRQAQKMEAVGQLTGGLAHDFNNILIIISGSIELLQQNLQQGDTEKLERYAAVALAASHRGAALTHRLLAFSRRQTLAPKLVAPNELVLGMETMLQRAVGPEISITTDMPANTGMIQCDPNQLENAILNLAINARDAMPGGGRLSITTTNLQLDDGNAALRGMAPGRYVSLSVTDTGNGMSAAVLARAFDPFFTTKPVGKGTGLGLSMIYGFAKQSGGAATIQSKEGAGTTVNLLFPRATGASVSEPARRRASPKSSSAKTAGQTVLLVDDEPEVRFVIARMLARVGYLTLEAADGRGALPHLEGAQPIDLMVTDYGLPGGMNGRQLAEAARVLRPGLKVLFITGLTEPSLMEAAAADPGMDVITKPFEMDALAAKVGEMVSSGLGTPASAPSRGCLEHDRVE